MKSKIFDTPLAVILCNVLIAVLVFSIVMAEYALSLILSAAAVIVILAMDRFKIVSRIFDLYIRYKKAAIFSGIAMVILFPISLTKNIYIAHIATVATIYGIACLGLNFQMGSTDMTNFAPAAFMGIGAYSVGICTIKFGLSPWIGMLMGLVVSGVFGFIIGLPTLKTKGYYLSLVTMAIQLAFTELVKIIPYLGGSDGMSNVTKYSVFGFELYKRYTVGGIKFAPQVPYLYLCILFLIVCTYIAMRVYFSRTGLSLNTIAQDEIAANCMGMNVSRQKLFAFVIGGMFCGLAGSLFVGLEGYVGPDSYDFAKSLMLICMVILGGMDNSIGIIVGAFLLAIISEKLRDFADFQQLIYGAILVVMLIVRPNGIIPKRVRNYCGICRRQPMPPPSQAVVSDD
ncbi:MAG: branched-chain amino acid ABC transporter permease [Clostridia bacterium]|nr:branched-chain amino acid ABC transporter permease [Candidatus Pelethousia sp.]NCB30366.1 branched-chain amino acid ABC transporter permease [Clostridia bacterium]